MRCAHSIRSRRPIVDSWRAVSTQDKLPHDGARATTKLLANIPSVTGTQRMRSHRLGVIALAITPSAQYATTNHTSFRARFSRAGRMSRARVSTITPNISNTTMEIADATRIVSGNTPGYAPPHASAPQGAPADNANWNAAANTVNTANTCAAILVCISTCEFLWLWIFRCAGPMVLYLMAMLIVWSYPVTAARRTIALRPPHAN